MVSLAGDPVEGAATFACIAAGTMLSFAATFAGFSVIAACCIAVGRIASLEYKLGFGSFGEA
jgi:hypothetical protein